MSMNIFKDLYSLTIYSIHYTVYSRVGQIVTKIGN